MDHSFHPLGGRFYICLVLIFQNRLNLEKVLPDKIRKCNSFIQKRKETDGMKLQASLASVRGKLFEADNGDVKVGHLDKKGHLAKA